MKNEIKNELYNIYTSFKHSNMMILKRDYTDNQFGITQIQNINMTMNAINNVIKAYNIDINPTSNVILAPKGCVTSKKKGQCLYIDVETMNHTCFVSGLNSLSGHKSRDSFCNSSCPIFIDIFSRYKNGLILMHLEQDVEIKKYGVNLNYTSLFGIYVLYLYKEEAPTTQKPGTLMFDRQVFPYSLVQIRDFINLSFPKKQNYGLLSILEKYNVQPKRSIIRT